MNRLELLPWRLDVNESGLGWLIIRSGDEPAAADAHRASIVLGHLVTGHPERIVDPQVGPALAYPVEALS